MKIKKDKPSIAKQQHDDQNKRKRKSDVNEDSQLKVPKLIIKSSTVQNAQCKSYSAQFVESKEQKKQKKKILKFVR